MTSPLVERLSAPTAAAHPLVRLADRAAFGLLVLLALLFPFEIMLPVARLGVGPALTNVELLLVAALAAWGASCLLSWRLPRVPPTLALPVSVWVAVLVLSAAFAPSYQDAAWRFMSRFVQGVLIGWAVYDQARTPDRRGLLLRAMACAGLAVGIIGLAETSEHPRVMAALAPFKFAPTRVGEVLRVSSTLGYATIASMVMEMTLPLALAWIVVSRRGWVRGVVAVAFLAALAGLVLTLTRGGVIALMAALALVIYLAWRRQRRGLLVAGAAAAAVALLFVLLAFFANPLAALRLVTESERAWYNAAYVVPETLTAAPGQSLRVPVQVTNQGVREWRGDGPQPFALAYHLFRDGEVYQYEGVRTGLPALVAPGGEIALSALLVAPTEPGEYVIRWDMVHEQVAWFSWKLSPQGRTVLTVEQTEGAPAAAPLPDSDVSVPYAPVGRLALWFAALRMTAERPLLGVGPDNFRYLYGPYAGLRYWDTNIHTNSLYVEWLVDSGIVGLVVFLWFAWTLAEMVARGIGLWPLRAGDTTEVASMDGAAGDSTAWVWQVAVAAVLLAWFVHGLFDFFYEFTPTYVAFWMMTGVATRGVATRGVDADRV